MSDEHLDLEVLAELDEDLLDDARAATVRAHLATCDACRERAGTLRATRALLSALPSPAMPIDVANRIDAAIAAEPAPPAPVPTTVVPLTKRRAWWRHPNLAAAAAAVAAIALGSAVVVGKVGAGNDGSKRTAPNAASALGAATTGAPKQWATGTNYTRTTVATLVPHLVLGVPPSPLPAGPTAPLPTQHGSSSNSLGSSSTGKLSYSQAALRDPIALAGCATLLNAAPSRPIAVDYAKYEGAPATILVTPDPRKPLQFMDVWVIRSVCSDTAVDLTFYELPLPR